MIAAESVRLFDTATWREIARVAHATEPVDAAAFSPDGTRLATVSSYIGQVALWDTSDWHAVAIFPGTVASPETSQLARGTGVAFSSDGRRIATSMGTIIDTCLARVHRRLLRHHRPRRGHLWWRKTGPAWAPPHLRLPEKPKRFSDDIVGAEA